MNTGSFKFSVLFSPGEHRTEAFHTGHSAPLQTSHPWMMNIVFPSYTGPRQLHLLKVEGGNCILQHVLASIYFYMVLDPQDSVVTMWEVIVSLNNSLLYFIQTNRKIKSKIGLICGIIICVCFPVCSASSMKTVDVPLGQEQQVFPECSRNESQKTNTVLQHQQANILATMGIDKWEFSNLFSESMNKTSELLSTLRTLFMEASENTQESSVEAWLRVETAASCQGKAHICMWTTSQCINTGIQPDVDWPQKDSVDLFLRCFYRPYYGQ